jgi:hypothetical protein
VWLLGAVLGLLFCGCEFDGGGNGENVEDEPKTVVIPRPALSLALRSGLDGAEIHLLPGKDSVELAVEIAEPGGDPPPGVTRLGMQYFLMVEGVSPARRLTVTEIVPELAVMYWNPPPGDGHYRLWLETLETYKVPPGVRVKSSELLAGQTVLRRKSGEIHLQVPASYEEMEGGYLHGVSLGEYPNPYAPGVPPVVSANPHAYQPPGCFYRVDDRNRGLLVSRNFRLSSFDLTFDHWTPSYEVPYEFIALHPRLLEKLERLRSMVREEVDPQARFELLAGYRSPWYNETVKRVDREDTQTSEFSAHMYGRAADLIVDKNGDGVMDDLNGDGEINVADCRVLERLADRIDAVSEEGPDSLLGGFGVYPRHDITSRSVQTPYVHVDVRGYLNSQGMPPRWYMD